MDRVDAIARLNKSLAGRYTVETEIGRGGMAAVYLAHDERHDRPVALKVFDAEFRAALGAERFLAEIRVTARLQHPGIVPLFDSGEADAALFYVMPFIDGESLRAKLQREKQLPVDEAVRIATSVADAMSYAHRHGIVHRDLKPENILLHDRRLLVADFGIALAMSNAGGPRLTQTGVSLGTPQYMSPEQASADGPVDARSDIYSLGAVLYEMLTGDPPHTANTTQALVARVLTETPLSPRAIRPTVPAHVDLATMRALHKLPADRWPTAAQFAEALAMQPGVASSSAAGTSGTIAQRSVARGKSARRRWIGAGAIAAVGIAIAVAWWSRSPKAASVSFILEPPTGVAAGARVAIGDVAVSDDGKLLAYVLASDSASAVYVRKVDDVTSTRVRGTEGAFFVSFSPDAKWLAVVTTDRRLMKVAVDGSNSLTVVENWGRLWGGVAWESNESLILPGDGLHRVSAAGGPIRRVTTPRPQRRHYMALVAGDGETVAFHDAGLGFTEDDFLALGSLKTGQYHTTSLLLTRPIGIVDNHIVYATATGAIMAVPFSARERRVAGDPIRISEGLVFDVSNAKMSPTGTLVYRTGRRTNRLVVERDGQTTEILPEVNGDVRFLSAPRFSPDAKRVAVSMQTSRGDTLTSDIWVLDVASRSFTRLTSLGNVLNPTWTPDGRSVVFGTWFYREPSLWLQAADGSRPPQRLYAGPDGARLWQVNVTHDGVVTFCEDNVDGRAVALYSVPLSGGPKADRIEILDADCDAELSPDGRRLAYAVTDGQKRNVYVRAYPRPTGRVRVSPNGGTRPRWSRDGRLLYYAHTTAADGSGVLFGADLRFSATGVAIGRIDSIAALKPGTFFDVARDGSVLRLEPVPWTDQVVVKTNWLTELRAKLR